MTLLQCFTSSTSFPWLSLAPLLLPPPQSDTHHRHHLCTRKHHRLGGGLCRFDGWITWLVCGDVEKWMWWCKVKEAGERGRERWGREMETDAGLYFTWAALTCRAELGSGWQRPLPRCSKPPHTWLPRRQSLGQEYSLTHLNKTLCLTLKMDYICWTYYCSAIQFWTIVFFFFSFLKPGAVLLWFNNINPYRLLWNTDLHLGCTETLLLEKSICLDTELGVLRLCNIFRLHLPVKMKIPIICYLVNQNNEVRIHFSFFNGFRTCGFRGWGSTTIAWWGNREWIPLKKLISSRIQWTRMSNKWWR